MKVAAFLPAKGTSTRVPGKNMKLLNGKPLFMHTLEKLCECDFIDEVYLDSDSDEILEYASYLNFKPFKRTSELASNVATGDMLTHNAAKHVEADIYVHIFCTTPFIKKETIKEGVFALINNPEYDSAVLAKKEKQYIWKDGAPAYYVDGKIPNSFDLPDVVSDTMGLYVTRRDVALNKKRRIGDKPYLLFADPIEAIDINRHEDFELAEKVSRGIQYEEYIYFKSMAHFFNSSVFSDVLCKMGVKSTITGLNLNLDRKKLMGRANTLKIKAVRDGETYHGIYDALKTYEKMQAGDIIVVENEYEDRAYFGELNANLALRAGTSGAIISGKTRDSEAVGCLDYPVFSSGYSCFDIHGTATFGGHNKPVCIKGVTINPGDLIFADVDGIVVIPRKMEKEVLNKAIDVIKTEKSILNRILDNENAYSIYQKSGEF